MPTPTEIPNGKPDRTALYQSMAENVDQDIHSSTYNEETGIWDPPSAGTTGILPTTTFDQAAAAGA